jgi:hypothetical protein
MNQIDIYKAAIGGRHQNYYLRAFERIEMRDYFSIAIWNWAAFFFGANVAFLPESWGGKVHGFQHLVMYYIGHSCV